MPDRTTTDKAKEDLREGKSPTTAAGEFVHEEMRHIHAGKHGARSTKQAIAIGLSEARRAGVPLKPPAAGSTSARTRRSAERAYQAGQRPGGPKAPSPGRSRATANALKREGRRVAGCVVGASQEREPPADQRRTLKFNAAEAKNAGDGIPANSSVDESRREGRPSEGRPAEEQR
jgi:hypothetical protein